ncbi:PREDICTED: uncharacterized protein LOC108358142 isoform X2 [Rhagoletis zephyria]|uniref:uncharacterized protein LOC108358142 isoform X2 n=1 Tax=Rhagoletis zephyria TaxID=28612 RepID=UPI000811AAC6|nr:PREDICTED: uncharacterized protein LOC108358142 isoform X2 [Rhagoletis zephyria]
MFTPKHKTKLYLHTIGLLLISYIGACSSSQPPYQVSLYVSLHPRAPPIHYCNGVIVQSHLVLTTASCTFYQSSVIAASSTSLVPIPTDKISVVPGAAGTYNVMNTFNVLEINIANGFNSTTLANNLALLRLDTALPLGQRDDVQWIIQDDYEYETKGLYMAAFPSLNTDPNIMQLERVRILPNERCIQANELTEIIRKQDICALYPQTYAVGPDCEFPADYAAFNSDYGTGLIIRSHLVALFSHTISTTSNQNAANNCDEEQSLKAIFTTVGPHLGWIYGIIASEEMLTLNEKDIMHSAPYQQHSSSAIQYILSSSAAESTSSSIGTTIATTRTNIPITIKAGELLANPSGTEVYSSQSLTVNGSYKAVNIQFE